MKVVVAALSAPQHLNGVSRHAANVVRGLLTRPEISEVHLLAGAWQQQTYADAIARHDARLHIHPVTSSRATVHRNHWYYSELPRIASQLDADVVHLAYPMPVSARGFPCPTVVSLHDLYAFDIPANFGFLKSILNRQVVRQCLKSVDAIACVSESTRQQLGHWFGSSFADKAVTILNSVESATANCARGPQPLHKGQPFLLCVAQHRRNKNIPLTLRIFEQCLRAGAIPPETQLVVVGVPGPETRRIQRDPVGPPRSKGCRSLRNQRFRAAMVLSQLRAASRPFDRRGLWSAGRGSLAGRMPGGVLRYRCVSRGRHGRVPLHPAWTGRNRCIYRCNSRGAQGAAHPASVNATAIGLGNFGKVYNVVPAPADACC